jgi:CubicO group peptidase (beta-lactamase class C family)
MRPHVRLSLIAATAIAALAAVAGAAPAPSSRQVTRDEVRRAIDNVYGANRSNILGMCAGVVDGQFSVIRCYGKTAPGGHTKPNRSTLFKIASLTKTFTGTLLALYVHDGYVHYSTPARKYMHVPGAGSIPKAMTLLALANHFSGLPRDPLPNKTVSSDADLYKDVVLCERTSVCPNDVPDHSFLYSNYAFAVLGDVIARARGYPNPPGGYSPWEAAVRADILAPLGIYHTNTGTYWLAEQPAEFAAHRSTGDEAGTPVTVATNGSAPWTDPGGALWSSSSDMLRWLRYSMGLSGPPALKALVPLLYSDPQTVRPRKNDPDKSIGLSWNADTVRGTTCVWKSGALAGFTSFIELVKDQRFGVFVLLNNRNDGADPAAIAYQLINDLPPAPISERCAPHGVE